MRKKTYNILVILGWIIILFFVLVAIFAPVIARYNPSATGSAVLMKPSQEHPLGTNDVGQDILSELIYGTRISMFIGVFAALVVTLIGTMLGVLAAYYGGILDKLITALTSLTMALPGLALTTLLVAYLNPGMLSVIISISITSWTGTARILRSRVFEIVEQPYIKIEKSLGQKDLVIMVKHILPNVKDNIFSRGAMAVSGAMMTESSISFLGLGKFAQKSWGSILHYAFFQKGVIRGFYWWYLPPIICTSLAVLGFMLVGYYGSQDRR